MDRDWTRAFARQALSDLRARDVLEAGNADKCHKLHFLQMAAEKVCKAFLISTKGHEKVRRSHAYVQKYIPIIARQAAVSGAKLALIKRLAREIEVLAPACDEGETRPDNTEYPWQDVNGNVLTPCLHNFAEIDLLEKDIRPLVRILQFAAKGYL